MWVDDGQALNFCGLSGIAVGWLERGHRYRTAAIPPHVIDRLAEVLSRLAWGPGCFGYHHCDLGLCRARLKMRFPLERISSWLFLKGSYSKDLKDRIANSLHRDATMRRALSRHHRRHGSANFVSEPPMPNVVEKLRTTSTLWVADAVEFAVTATMRATRAATNVVDPRPHQERWGGTPMGVGCSNLFIPGSKQIYIAPSMVLHYILRHQYRPPDEFCDALLRCPPIGTRIYFEKLRPGMPTLPTGEFDDWVDQQLALVQNREASVG